MKISNLIKDCLALSLFLGKSYNLIIRDLSGEKTYEQWLVALDDTPIKISVQNVDLEQALIELRLLLISLSKDELDNLRSINNYKNYQLENILNNLK